MASIDPFHVICLMLSNEPSTWILFFVCSIESRWASHKVPGHGIFVSCWGPHLRAALVAHI